MRLTAYVLAADPHFLTASVTSYYGLVDRIVVSYDATGTSWTGTPIPVERCLEKLAALDTEGRCVLAPGSFHRPGEDPLANDTFQRQAALDQASDGADWVLQLDTDEVVPRPERFWRALRHADDAAATALDYPSRWLYARVGPGRYLESSTRTGRPAANYPGPLAVRAGTRLALARQPAEYDAYRVDLRPWSTDPLAAYDRTVHEVVGVDDAVVHYSWVRPPDVMRRKFGWSGHAAEYSEPVVYRRWAARQARPRLAAATSLVRRPGDWYRVATVRDAVEDDA